NTIQDIARTYFNFNLSNTIFDYYLNSDKYFPNISNIENNLNEKINRFRDFLRKYDNNRGLLNIKNIVLPRSVYFYKEFNKVVEYIINLIEENPSVYSHEFHNDPEQDIVMLTKQKYDTIDRYEFPANNAIDIMLFYENNFNNYISNNDDIDKFEELNKFNTL